MKASKVNRKIKFPKNNVKLILMIFYGMRWALAMCMEIKRMLSNTRLELIQLHTPSIVWW